MIRRLKPEISYINTMLSLDSYRTKDPDSVVFRGLELDPRSMIRVGSQRFDRLYFSKYSLPDAVLCVRFHAPACLAASGDPLPAGT